MYRVPKEYLPTTDEGEVTDLPYRNHLAGMESWLGDIEHDLESGTVMVLAPAAFQLRSVISEARRRGLLYHNPFAADRGDWNPIKHVPGKLSMAMRLYNFVLTRKADLPEDAMTWAEFDSWVSLLNADVFSEKGMKKSCADRAKQIPKELVWDVFWPTAFKPEHVESAKTGNVGWLAQNVLASKLKSLEYPIAIYNRRGNPDDLLADPKLIFGTCHSVKGGEADTVYIVPDLPPRFAEQWQSGDRDSLLRLFYVAVTRARKCVRILERGRGESVL